MRKCSLSILFIIIIPFILHAEKPSKNNHQPSSPLSGIPELIKTRLAQLALDSNTRIGGDKFHSIEYVSNLYVKNDYKLFWTEPGYIEDAINSIKSSYEDGLQPFWNCMIKLLQVSEIRKIKHLKWLIWICF